MVLISPAAGWRPGLMSYIFMAAGFFLAGDFFTRAIPHLGHLPGLSLNTSGCIVHRLQKQLPQKTGWLPPSALLFSWIKKIEKWINNID